MSAITWHLNEYHRTSVYGGPEEGGWYYNADQFVSCIGQFQSLEAARLAQQAHVDGSMRSGAGGSRHRTVYVVEETLGADYPAERPYYE